MPRFILLLSLLLALAAPAMAQTRTDQKKDERKTELPPIREAVTVTATRGEAAAENSPVSTSVVTLQENRIRNIQTLDQSLNLIEGVYAFRTKGPADTNTRVLMRGFNGQNRTLVLLDGQPVNDAYTGEVAWTSLPINEVDRIEVARGPFSSLYSGSALGGVINILTRPVERRELELSGQYGTYDSTNYSARYSDRFFEKLGVTIGYQRLQTGGYNTRPIQSSAATGTTGTLVTGIIPTLTTQGARIYNIGRAGDNWYNQHAGVRSATARRATITATRNSTGNHPSGRTGTASFSARSDGRVDPGIQPGAIARSQFGIHDHQERQADRAGGDD